MIQNVSSEHNYKALLYFEFSDFTSQSYWEGLLTLHVNFTVSAFKPHAGWQGIHFPIEKERVRNYQQLEIAMKGTYDRSGIILIAMYNLIQFEITVL